jgi:hypothetical protein
MLPYEAATFGESWSSRADDDDLLFVLAATTNNTNQTISTIDTDATTKATPTNKRKRVDLEVTIETHTKEAQTMTITKKRKKLDTEIPTQVHGTRTTTTTDQPLVHPDQTAGQATSSTAELNFKTFHPNAQADIMRQIYNLFPHSHLVSDHPQSQHTSNSTSGVTAKGQTKRDSQLDVTACEHTATSPKPKTAFVSQGHPEKVLIAGPDTTPLFDTKSQHAHTAKDITTNVTTTVARQQPKRFKKLLT